MSWPFVSRVTHTLRVAELKADIAVADARLDHALTGWKQADEKYAELLALYHALKVQGATLPPPPAVQRERDPLVELIHAKSGDNLRLRAMMLRQLATDRKANVPEAEIRHAIENGTPAEGLPV